MLEDCAQAYAGTRFRGHPDADLALFSFGPMKTGTALGGAIAGVRCPGVFADMRRLRDADPAQPTLEYWRRTVLYGVFKALTQPSLFGAFAKVADTLGTDREQWLHGLTRNVPPEDLIRRLRRRPCTTLLRVLHRRLASGDSLLKRRSEQGTVLADALGAHVALPTRAAMPHGFWMVPVLPRDRRALVQGLRDAGFDAMSGRLATVEGNARGTPGAATLAEAVFVPFDPSIPRPAHAWHDDPMPARHEPTPAALDPPLSLSDNSRRLPGSSITIGGRIVLREAVNHGAEQRSRGTP